MTTGNDRQRLVRKERASDWTSKKGKKEQGKRKYKIDRSMSERVSGGLKRHNLKQNKEQNDKRSQGEAGFQRPINEGEGAFVARESSRGRGTEREREGRNLE